MNEALAQLAPGVAPENLTNVVGGTNGLSEFGGLKWRGNAGLTWSRDKWTLGTRAQYFGSYHQNPIPGFIVPGQGSATVPSQIYFDLFGSHKFPGGLEARVTLNNVLDRSPPVDVTNRAGFYSRFGDPRLGRYYLALTKSF